MCDNCKKRIQCNSNLQIVCNFLQKLFATLYKALYFYKNQRTMEYNLYTSGDNFTNVSPRYPNLPSKNENATLFNSAPSSGLFNFVSVSLMMAGLLTKMALKERQSGGFSRRKRNIGLNDVFTRESNIFYRVLGDLDQEDCIALAICHASSIDLFNRKRNEKLLDALGINKDRPVPWKDISDIKAKFQYAAFVGHTLGVEDVQNGCKGAFPSCALPAQDVLKLLTNEVQSCETMMKSLNELMPKSSSAHDQTSSESRRVIGHSRKRNADYYFRQMRTHPRKIYYMQN